MGVVGVRGIFYPLSFLLYTVRTCRRLHASAAPFGKVFLMISLSGRKKEEGGRRKEG